MWQKLGCRGGSVESLDLCWSPKAGHKLERKNLTDNESGRNVLGRVGNELKGVRICMPY